MKDDWYDSAFFYGVGIAAFIFSIVLLLWALWSVISARAADLPFPRPRPASAGCAPITDAGKTREGYILVWDGVCPTKLKWVKQ